LVSGACFSEFGVDVICVDKDKTKIEKIQEGIMPIFEPGLEDLVIKNVNAGRLSFTTDLPSAVKFSDAVFIAVGTPSRRGDGHADLSYVYAAAEEIAESMEGHTIIVTKSTVPVGTGREVEGIVARVCPGANYEVVSNPEFLREGSAIEDFMRPDRVVIGTKSERAQKFMRMLYRPLHLIETPILFTSRQTAEMIKYAANTFLATKITFINEIADLCEVLDADIQEVAKGIGLDGRIGGKFLHAGPGYGGSCFPKDTLALVRTAMQAGKPLRIVETVVDINNKRKQQMAERVVSACGGTVEGKKICILGVTFKPKPDDMRDSPSIDIIAGVQKSGAFICAYDPEGMDEANQIMMNVNWCKSAYEAIEGSDAMVIITEWNEFRGLDMKRVKSLMKTPILVDLRNVYNPTDMKNTGIAYSCIGRSV
jgi:UDPglucose 6-dehydrogenase